MNERYIELYKQAWVSCTHKDPSNNMPYESKEFSAKKFAELILNDIDGIVGSLYHTVPLEQSGILLTLNEQIKEHFYGVEE
jgi:hypothetical protein